MYINNLRTVIQSTYKYCFGIHPELTNSQVSNEGSLIIRQE